MHLNGLIVYPERNGKGMPILAIVSTEKAPGEAVWHPVHDFGACVIGHVGGSVSAASDKQRCHS